MFSVIKNAKIWFLISGLLVAASIVSVSIWGLRLGIDFHGGTLREIEFAAQRSASEIRDGLDAAGFIAQVQEVGERSVIIKTEPLTTEEQTRLTSALREKFGDFQEHRFESIGPAIGRELLNRAYWQILLVSLGIVFYVSYSFRKINANAKHFKISPWKLGFATIIALLHDLTIPLGVFAILGHFRGVELDSLFVTALLTILGFSVHDTIVVFDRIRESTLKMPEKNLSEIIDLSVLSTMTRSINTSSTLVFIMFSSLLFGGNTIFYFVLALLIGVIAGTYSSIFIASPILYLWRKR
ncbi:MAG: protein-export membrane protein SecF [Candidatus Doudnabacteria bacterium RIFCSPHIGHO2_01_FULL_49_9]|uniref:Protein-export membrane protein SecF n=1 Tax=Candidatus Doudnabacteria bacterium RIFCSPHIGHO2_01_FULL_49_9 TaxID=1817827 RepID=A0A1F5NZY7_9BACT|nr:MAG: protein-export membrane protein SecF [Candidatus Doudnabacteria bacterium RIFCSPHIGHO2_01_FULL_49_9]